MGNRQSSPQDGQQQQNQPDANGRTTNTSNNNSSGSGGGGGAMRPGSRLQSQRDTLRSAFIPVNENQRRDERRLRRERIREQQLNGGNGDEDASNSAALLSSVTEAMFAAAALRNATAAASAPTPATEAPNISPFSRMIASVISEAVVTSFRNGHIPTPQQGDSAGTTSTTTTTPSPARAENVRQELTMHLSPEVFQQMEPGSAENSFMRFIRLPVIVTSVSTAPSTTTAVNADGEAPTLTPEESEVTRIIMLPVFLYGIRSNPTTTNGSSTSSAAPSTPTTTTPTTTTTTTTPPAENNEEGDSPTRRRSARLRAAAAAAAPSSTSTPTPTQETQTPNGQWTVYIISGPNVDGIVSENASYEELLDLASIIGPARLPTVSQEAIDDVIPKVKFNLEVKQSMVGNSEGCQICLTNYQSQDEIRILGCHHGFHDECICKWLTQGRNQCPLCRVVPVPVQES